jgi:hypothetical protein
METPLILLLLFLLVFLILRFLWVRTDATRGIYQEMIIISIPFLAGVFAGTSGTDLITDHLRIQISPLLHFCLGFQGLYWGLFFGFRDVRFLDVNIKRFSVLHSFFIFTVMLAGGFILLYLAGFPAWEILIGGIYLALALTQISSASLLFLEKFGNYSSSFAFLFKTVSGLSGLFTIILFGFLSPMGVSTSLPFYLLNLVLQILIAFFTGHLTLIGIRRITRGEGMLIWLLGILLINSGIAYYFGFNPLFMNLISGTVISTQGFWKQQVRNSLKPLVRPVILFLLFYTGLSMEIHFWLTPLIVPGLILFRYILNCWSFRHFFSKQVLQTKTIRPVLSSLMPLGVLTPAIAVHLHLISHSASAGIITGSLGLAYIGGYFLMILLVNAEGSS